MEQIVSPPLASAPEGTSEQAERLLFCARAKEGCEGCRLRVIFGSFFTTGVGLIFKGIFGVICGSQAIVADAVHSLTDTLAFGANYLGARMSSQTPEAVEGQYSSMVGSVVLLSGVFICADNLTALVCEPLAHPGMWSLVLAVVATLVNWQLCRTSGCASRRFPDSSVYVCYVQNRTNFFASCISLASVALAEFGLLFFDPLGAVVIGGLLIASSVTIFKTEKPVEARPDHLDEAVSRGHSNPEMAKGRGLLPAVLGVMSLGIVGYFGAHIHHRLAQNFVLLVPAHGPSLSSPTDEVLGRAQYFLVVDTRRRTVTPMLNQFRTLNGDVSTGVLSIARTYQVDAVLAQKIGKEMYQDLNAAGIGMFYFEGPATVEQVVAGYQTDQLSLARGANVGKGYGLAEMRWLRPW